MERSVVTIGVWLGAILCAQAQSFNLRSDYKGLQGPEIGWSIERHGTGYIIFQAATELPPIASYREGQTLLDENGTLAIQRSFGADSLSYVLGWCNTSDSIPGGGYVACGSRCRDHSSDCHPEAVLWRFGQDGDSLWCVPLFPNNDDESLGSAAAVLNDGSILAVGGFYAASQSGDVFLCKVDPTGQVLWTHLYGGSSDDAGQSISVAADGSIYVAGNTYGFPGPDQNILLLKTDPSGEQQWMRTPGSPYDDQYGSTCTTPDSGVVWVGADADHELGNTPYVRPTARRYSRNGDLLWYRQYDRVSIAVFHQLQAVKALSDGTFIACGSVHRSTYPQGTLLHLAANGDSLWMRTYSHPSLDSSNINWTELRDVLPAVDGGYAACGVAFDGQQDMWAIHVDSCGCLVPGCQLYDHIAEEQVQLHVLLYPDPATDHLFISFRSAADPHGSFQVLDNSGRLVRTFMAEQRSTEIDLDIRELPPGMYVLRYDNLNGQCWSEKFMKQ